MWKEVVLYDALAWHWEEHSDLWVKIKALITHPNAIYLAQDFVDVRERLVALAAPTNKLYLIPPIVNISSRIERKNNQVFLNLGGIQNPFVDIDHLNYICKSNG